MKCLILAALITLSGCAGPTIAYRCTDSVYGCGSSRGSAAANVGKAGKPHYGYRRHR